MSNKDVIENLEFCLYKGRCTECSLGEEKSMLSCRTLLEDCRTALKNSVEVVRCKDCKYFQPRFVRTNDGERRPYTEEEIKKGKMVTGDVGINCGSRCERFGYWDENKIPVWYNENDFCSSKKFNIF